MSFCSCLERISVSLSSPACSKKKVLETLSKMLAEKSSINSKLIFERLLEREKIGSTGLGKGVALPHCRINGIEQPLICFLNTQAKIDYGSPDDLPVTLFFALLIPEKENTEYLELIAQLAQKLDRAGCIHALQKASSAAQVAKILKSEPHA